MYSLYDYDSEEEENTELTYEIVGALMRRFPRYTHVAKTWGDPEKDSSIPNLEELAAKYNYQAIMSWILGHPEAATASYSEKFSSTWNQAEVVGVSMTDQAMMQMVVTREGKTEAIDMKNGALSVMTPMETLNHQLATLMVASFPPEKYKDEKGVPRCRPSVCDVNGLFGPSRQYLPYLKPTGDEETAHGGPLMRAYGAPGGAEGIVARVETAMNKPAKGTVQAEHFGVVRNLATTLATTRKNGAKYPKWYDPYTPYLKGGDPPRMKLLREISYKPFTSVDQHYVAYTYMATTCGVTKRASYVFDGHYFADMPAGMAPKIHRLNNLMNVVHNVKVSGIGLVNLPKPIESLRPLLPLNLPCFTNSANAKLTEKVSTGFDPRYRPGLFKLPTKQGNRILMFRELLTDRPMLKKGKVVYSPSNPRQVIKEHMASFPPSFGIAAFVTVAHPTLWEEPLNYIFPFDLLTGEVFVVRGINVDAKVEGHITYPEYLNVTSHFIHSRMMYPYSRVSWPQLSGQAHARILLKKGEISATDTAYSILKAQMDDSDYQWEPSALYHDLKDTEVTPSAAQQKLIAVPPQPKPAAVAPIVHYEEAEGPINDENGEAAMDGQDDGDPGEEDDEQVQALKLLQLMDQDD